MRFRSFLLNSAVITVKTTLATHSHLSDLEWFFIQLLVNSEIFDLSLNLSLMHLRDLSACYEIKGGLRPVRLKEISHHSLRISKFTRTCKENRVA